MSSYQTTPFKQPPQLLVAGTPSYVFGSYDDRSSPTAGTIISDSAVTTTGTVTFQILDGNAPSAGDKITVRGTANGSGNFNVTNATILTATTTGDGICTVTYTISSSTVAANTPDVGQVLIPRIEIGETIAAVGGVYTSVPVAAPFINSVTQQGRTVIATATFPTPAGIVAPTSGNVWLQGANFDIDAQYMDLAAIAGAGSPSFGPSGEVGDDIAAFRFYRLQARGLAGGTNPQINGKILA